jgi:dihydrofolate synthase/folylpolyglutamate synthase
LAQARAVGAPVVLHGRDYGVADAGGGFDVLAGCRRWSDLRVGLHGRFQRTNAAAAVMLLQCLQERFPVTDAEIREGFRAVSWPGRLDVMSMRPFVVLDGAHNPSAARALADELGRTLTGRRLRLVFGAMRDKDWREMWAALRPLVVDAIVTQPRTSRSAAAEVIARVIGKDVPVRVIPDPHAAAAAALEASAPDDAVLVTGSLFLVGDVYPFFRQAGPGAGFQAGTPMLPMLDHFAHDAGNAGAASAEAGSAGRSASRNGRGRHRRRAAAPGVVGPPRAQ